MPHDRDKILTRRPADGPFCWQSKAARRAIRDAFDATHNVTSALAVYDALTEIASDAAGECFFTTHAWISRMSGVSPSTIKRTLPVLAELGLLKIETAALRAPSRYTLLAIANRAPALAHGEPALAHGEPALAHGSFHDPWATSEEHQKNIREKTDEERARPAKPASPADEKAWLEDLVNDPAYKGIDVMREHAKMLVWCRNRNLKPTRRRFINWLNRIDLPLNGKSTVKAGPVPWQRPSGTEIEECEGF